MHKTEKKNTDIKQYKGYKCKPDLFETVLCKCHIKMRNLNMIFITSILFELFNIGAHSLSFFKFNRTTLESRYYLHFKSTEPSYMHYYY